MKDGPIIKEKPKKQNRMQVKLLLFLFFVLAILVAIPYYFLFYSQQEDFLLRSYTYAPVKTRTFVRRLNVSGTVEPKEVVLLKSPLSGHLTQLQVTPGRMVAEGELLAIIESKDLEQEIQKTQETIGTLERELQELQLHREIQERKENLDLHLLEERLRKAREDLILKEKLFQLGTISLKDLEEAKTTLKSVQVEKENSTQEQALKRDSYELEYRDKVGRLKKTKEDLSHLLEELEKTRIKSPINGLLMEVKKEENSSINRNDDVFLIIDMETSMVILKIGENDVIRIREDQMAQVRVANTIVEGRVTFISPQTERTQDGPVVEVHISLEEVPPNLRAYSTAIAEFELLRRDNIPYLPRGDYLTSGEYTFVYKVEGDRAIRELVTFGQHEGTWIEVLSGLEVGDIVITSSYEEYKDKREINLNIEGGRPH